MKKREVIMKCLGYANFWREEPEELVKCREGQARGEEHELFAKNIGKCLNEYGCLTCGYKYTVDSGD